MPLPSVKMRYLKIQLPRPLAFKQEVGVSRQGGMVPSRPHLLKRYDSDSSRSLPACPSYLSRSQLPSLGLKDQKDVTGGRGRSPHQVTWGDPCAGYEAIACTPASLTTTAQGRTWVGPGGLADIQTCFSSSVHLQSENCPSGPGCGSPFPPQTTNCISAHHTEISHTGGS